MTENSTDHNSFFQNLSTSTESGSTFTGSGSTPTESDQHVVEISSDTDGSSIGASTSALLNDNQLLKLVIIKVDAMRKHLIELELKIDNIRDHGTNDPSGTIDFVKLNKLGLPVKTKVELETLETNLKDEDKRNQIVSFHVKFASIRYSLQIYLKVQIIHF